MHFSKIIKSMAISVAFTTALCSMNVAAQNEVGDTAAQTETASERETTAQTTETASENQETQTEKTTEKTTEKRTEKPTTESSTEKKKNTDTSKKKKKEKKTITAEKVKKLEKVDQEEEKLSVHIIPKVYNDHSLAMKNQKEMINGFVYFNQGDPAWNDNGYRIKKAGCGPTSMAVVITSLTGKWVTPVDTTVWAYEHGYYSGQGSSHALIPALSEEYGLQCEGVGTDAQAIREALQEGNPVVCLMGPGYFTKGGHFMVLVGIDENDNVTVADVGSRERSRYKYQLSDIIDQSKPAAAGGPFWVISNPDGDTAATKDEKASEEKSVEEDEVVSTEEPMEYGVIQDTDEDSIREIVQAGHLVMMMSDGKVLDGEEFIYIMAVNSNGVATITDRSFEKKEQYSFTDLFSHVKTDFTGLSFWQVSGESHQFLMPFSQKIEGSDAASSSITE